MRYLCIVFVCVLGVLLFLGCSGKHQASTANPNQPPDAVTLQGLDGLAFPEFDGAPPRIISVDIPDEKLGRETFQRSLAETDGDSLHVFAEGVRSLAFGVYRFDGLTDADAVLEVEIERTDLQAQGGYYLGVADYNTMHWHWSEHGSTQAGTETDTISMPSGVNPISPGGYAYIAILLYDGAEMWIDTVTLTSDIDIEAPVASFTATPSHANTPETVEFDASDSFVRGGGDFSTYAWDFENDGTIDETNVIATANHGYTEPGVYYARLVVTADTNGYTDEHIVPIYIHGWIHTWGGTERQRLAAIERRGDFLYAVGTDNAGTDVSDYLLACFDVWGEPRWQVTYDSGGREIPYAMVLPNAETIVITGQTEGFEVENGGVLTVAFSTSGELLWEQVWDSPRTDSFPDLATDSSGNIYVALQTSAFTTSGIEIILLKYSPEGTLLWQHRISAVDAAFFGPVLCQSFNNLYIACPWLANDFVCLQLDTDGTLTNYSRYQRGLSFVFEDIVADISGNVYITGRQYQDEIFTDDKLFVARLDSTLTLQWANTWETTNYYSFGRSIELYTELFTVTKVLVAGNISGSGYTAKSILLEFNPSGDLQWARSWSSAEIDCGFYGSTLGIGGAFVFGGYAANNDLTRLGVLGEANAAACTANPFTPTVSDCAGNAFSPTGTVETTTGVLDTGGGSDDLLLIGYDVTD